MTAIQPTLRHYKKEVTGKALARAAFVLAQDRGLDGFVVDDIVQQAGVSRRTFANYFICKEEAIAAGAREFSQLHEDEFEHLIGRIEADMPLVDILFELIRLQLTSRILSQMQTFAAMCKTYPSLQPYFLNTIQQLQVEAERTLVDLSHGRYDEVYLKMLIGALYGAILPIIDGTIGIVLTLSEDEGKLQSEEYEHYIQKIYTYLKSGFK